MKTWQRRDEGLACETDDSTVRLTGPVGFDEAAARLELHEWTEYLVRAAGGARLQVYQGREPAERLAPDLWRVRYQNYIP